MGPPSRAEQDLLLLRPVLQLMRSTSTYWLRLFTA